MQWFKRFFELNVANGGEGYDARGRRARGRGAPFLDLFLEVSRRAQTKAPLTPSPPQHTHTPNQAASGTQVEAVLARRRCRLVVAVLRHLDPQPPL